MKIVDILVDSATLLGLTNEANALRSATLETEDEIVGEYEKIASLYNLIKFSIRELCTNYIPVIREDYVVTQDKKFALNTLPNFIRIQNIQKDGEVVKFKTINRNVFLEEDGKYLVRYESYPNVMSLFDEIDFLQNFSPDAIVFGLCAYYSIAHGMFDDFQEFHERYITKAESLRSLHNFDLPTRRWEWETKNLLK